jgi:hypothetical protein
LFPISAGGRSGNEIVSCVAVDAKNKQFIVAGNSTSDDWVPNNRPHAFVYSVDFEGNWRWGKYFYNAST